MANVAVSRQACFALALLVWSTAAGVRAEDAPQPQQQPAAMPSAISSAMRSRSSINIRKRAA